MCYWWNHKWGSWKQVGSANGWPYQQRVCIVCNKAQLTSVR